MATNDLIIIGGGIVGLATAFAFQKAFPGKKLVILEKESEVARHQSEHNSGVLHTGIYYRPDSLRALHCRLGKQMMEDFCRAEGIPFNHCGKVIVATTPEEEIRLKGLLERGKANGVNCRMIGVSELREIEPHCRGLAAIHVPEAGIISYREVALVLAKRVVEAGGEIRTHQKVLRIQEEENEVRAVTIHGEITGQWLVNCAGLHSDRVTACSGVIPSLKIFPFRGEYYLLKPGAQHLCRGLIYPVPNPQFPFLGVHFTRVIGGGVECGPNAVLALAREGYSKWNINLRDLVEMLSYPGFYRMAKNHWRMGLDEMKRSYSKAFFVRSLQKLVPSIQAHDVTEAPAGVRAQALLPNGNLLDDFAIQPTRRMVHLINAPSPAATASLRVGELVVEKLKGLIK